jgi:hypothetical protein
MGVNSNENIPHGPSRRFFPWNSQNFLWMHDLQSSPFTEYMRRATSIPTFRWNETLLVARICWHNLQRAIAPIDAETDILAASCVVGLSRRYHAASIGSTFLPPTTSQYSTSSPSPCLVVPPGIANLPIGQLPFLVVIPNPAALADVGEGSAVAFVARLLRPG